MSRAKAKIAVGSVAVLVGALTGGLAPSASAAPAAAPPADCPTVAPTASVRAGTTGTGWTVVTGSTPQPFGVDILGVISDGIAPGRDLVMVKVFDLPGQHVVDQGGGIWAGMSGSPVYVDGQLVGAVSYGFTLAPSPLGGMTPAADMLSDLGAGDAPDALRPKVPLTAKARAALASEARVAAPRGSLSPVPTPLGVSGLRPDRLERLQRDVTGAGLPLSVHAAGRAAAPAAGVAPTSRPVAGGNFAGAVAYGDVTFAGTGTTTYVCGDRALAFGHPFTGAGATTYGANDADSLAIVQDDTFGSFKQANLGPLFGTLDQDRTVGIRADLTSTPATTPVTTTVRNLDNGRARTGATQVTDQSYLAEVAAYGSLANLDRVFDESGDGRASTSWTIKGTRAGGKAFTIGRSNSWASRYGLTEDPAFEVAYAVDSLVNNDFEPVTISSVDLAADVTTSYDQLHVVKIEVAVNGGSYKTPKTLKVKAGAKLKVRVTMKRYRSTSTVTAVTDLKVPKGASRQSGLLSAVGGLSTGGDPDGKDGADDSACLLEGSGCDNGQEGSLDDVISEIKKTPRNDDLLARLSFDDSEESDEGTGSSAAVTSTVRQKLTVVGSRSIAVTVR